MFKGVFLATVISVFFFSSAFAQTRALGHTGTEFGIIVGACNFLGDLGGANRIGRPLFFDLNLSMTRPVIGVMYRHNFNPYMATRIGFYWGNVAGDDRLIEPRSFPEDPEGASDEWYRWYRNIHFKSYILEFSAKFEVHLSRFEIDHYRYRFAPYVFTGVGGFAFNPKAQYNGEWVKLRDLGTEGQGLPEYPGRQKYSLFQICLPVGVGFKYNINRQWTIGFEYGHRFTFTDYIDDVSTTYIDPQYLHQYYSPEEAEMIAALSRRSVERDPENRHGYVTAPGQQRGDPTDFDSYIFTGVITITYTVSRGRIYCPKF